MRCPAANRDSTNVDLRPRNDHYCVPEDTNNFGGYICNINFNDQTVGIRKERTHDIGYSDKQAVVSYTLPADTWIGIKGICYVMPNGNVKVEDMG